MEQTAYEQRQAEQQEAEDVMAEIDGLADLDYQVSALESLSEGHPNRPHPLRPVQPVGTGAYHQL